MAEAAATLQQDAFESIYKLQRNFKKDSKERHNLGYFKARQQRLAELWTTCSQHHKTIISSGKLSPEKLEEYNNEFNEVEEAYMDLLEVFETGLSQYASLPAAMMVPAAATPPDTARTISAVRLESIAIPTFDGNYAKWRTFFDLFTCMVHKNQSLSAVEKMQYLKTHLSGDAARVIQHMDISNESYDAAWLLLNERFDNKRAMAWSYMHKFFDIPPVKEESDTPIKNMLDSTSEFLANMESIGIDTDHWDALIIFIVSQKLDLHSRKLWESSLGSSPDVPELKLFTDFLTARFRTLEALGAPKKTKKFESLVVKETVVCSYCKRDHSIMNCSTFKGLSLNERRNVIKEQKACYNCLRKGHNIMNCQSRSSCHVCKKRHHTLLHFEHERASHSVSNPAVTKSLISKQANEEKIVLLATAKLNVKDVSGQIVTLRALVDSGSQKSFITENAAQILGTKRIKTTLNVSGLGSSTTIKTRGLINLDIFPRNGKIIRITTLIISKITNICPAREIKLNLSQRFKISELADPDYGIPGNIDILLGADVYGSIVLPEFRQGAPFAVNTKLGWILLGPVDSKTATSSVTSMVTTEDTTNEILKKLWELEEVPSYSKFTEGEQEAIDFYKATTKRDTTGRYTVKLPFKANTKPGRTLHNSRKNAYIQFSQLEKRLAANEQLKTQYMSFIKEYMELGHMEEVDPKRIHAADTYYLPHHAVLKQSSTTTKLRVVFNASQLTPEGKSLNDLLLVGPSIQNNLISIIMKWRKPKYVIAADIEKMFRQIQVDPKDRDFLRILWRDHPSEKLKHYRLTTVTYGTSSAPYLAIQTLHQLAEDENSNYPEACKVIKEDMYVDDVFTGANTIEAAKQLQTELNLVMTKGGFHLRKWTANHASLLETISPEDRETQLPLAINVTENIKALGLQWNPVNDAFSFKVSLPPNNNQGMTKRQLLSETCQLFDPIGWIQPCVIIGRIIMQQLWLKKTGWDEPINELSYSQWIQLKNQLPILQEIVIPR